jgi:hypothetical protein
LAIHGGLCPFLLLSGCTARDSNDLSETIEGPESKELNSRTPGYVVISESDSGLFAIRPETGEKREIFARSAIDSANDRAGIHAISGPDTNGTVAFIEDHFFVPAGNMERHLLKTVNLNGTGMQM